MKASRESASWLARRLLGLALIANLVDAIADPGGELWTAARLGIGILLAVAAVTWIALFGRDRREGTTKRSIDGMSESGVPPTSPLSASGEEEPKERQAEWILGATVVVGVAASLLLDRLLGGASGGTPDLAELGLRTAILAAILGGGVAMATRRQ